MEKLTPIPFEVAIENSAVPFTLEELKKIFAEELDKDQINIERLMIKIGSERLANILLSETDYYKNIPEAYNDVCKLKRFMSGMEK